MEKIVKIAKKVGIDEGYLELYGNYKAKISSSINERIKNNKDGKLILVTAITPTKAGEGKTTTSIALLDGLYKINKKAILCLREPSLGPVFGLKGGATGGGKATIEPSVDINLHFTGDMHALTSSINLISAVIDNHIYQGNELEIDVSRILWKRAIDMNDRELRDIEIGLGSEKNGIKREDHFEITVASELMAILCLSLNEEDFKSRIGTIIVAYNLKGKPIYLKQLKIVNAVMLLMNDALKPNLVQSSEGNPCFVHGGPFANIAHGCSSLIGTKLALKLAPYVVTEAGFGADLGAEKFYDITCRIGELKPSCCVLVATIRALKCSGGMDPLKLDISSIEYLKEGLKNLEQHYYNLKKYGVPIVVAINHFNSDSNEEIEFLKNWLNTNYIKFSFLDGYLKGGDGAINLANKVIETIETCKTDFKYLYSLDLPVQEKIKIICKEIYHAKEIIFSNDSLEQIAEIEKLGASRLPICIAKTPLSFTDDPSILNAPKDFPMHVRSIKVDNGAGFIVVYCGNILTLPGLPKIPQAVKMEG